MVIVNQMHGRSENNHSARRLIHVYTGEGKGKTTAALGLALRACGQGWRILFIQFLKGREDCGELKLCDSIPGFKMVRRGLPALVDPASPSEEDRSEAAAAFQEAQDAVLNGKFDLVILDEVNVAVDYGLIPLGEVTALLERKPDSVELVLTGRNAHPKLVEAADYVSEIKDVKHPFRRNVTARRGVDF
jgi:cob(I)alamin adenosyltransferase